MASINWGRLILGGLIAAIMMFFADGFIHERLVSTDWHAVYAGLNAAEPQPHGTSMVYFGLYELGRALIAMSLYATMRTHSAAGPQTVIVLAFAGWIAFSLTGRASFIPLRFFSNAHWPQVGAMHMASSLAAKIAGA